MPQSEKFWWQSKTITEALAVFLLCGLTLLARATPWGAAIPEEVYVAAGTGAAAAIWAIVRRVQTKEAIARNPK